MNYRLLRSNIYFGCSLPVGWYIFIYPDGSRSHELSGTNYPTSEIIGTVWGGDCPKDIYTAIRDRVQA